MLFYKIIGCFVIILNFYRHSVLCDHVEGNNHSETYHFLDENYIMDADLEILTNNKLFSFLYPSITPNAGLTSLQQIEEDAWHWMPYKRLQYFLETKIICPGEEPNEEFPDSIFTLEQLRQGAVVLYFLGAIYFFTLLTIICDTYFIPTVERICEVLNLPKDVAAATFMATATTTPEFFTNVFSTFILDSDLGIGTVIGSLMFNTLGVAALASLAAPKPVQIDWWPISRDSVLYSMNLAVLIGFAWDGQIFWYESMVFVILWVVYYVILFQNGKIMRFVKWIVQDRLNCCQSNKFKQFNRTISTDSSIDELETRPKIGDSIYTIENKNDIMKSTSEIIPSTQIANNPAVTIPANGDGDDDDDKPTSLWKIPTHSKLRMFWFFYTWPIKLILTCLIPNPKTYPKLFPLSFIMCIVCIGLNSYIIVWMMVRIGETLSIPDSVMGLTFLAAGGCLPEAISSIILARKGDGGVGVSNSLGANSLAIVYALGLPWFIRAMIDGGSSKGEHGAYVNIHSYGIEWVILSLILTVVCLYLVIALFGYKLRKIVGFFLIFTYFVFITFAILVELDVFFPSGNAC